MVTQRCKGCQFYSEKVYQDPYPEGVLIRGEYFKPIVTEGRYAEYCTKKRLHFDYVDQILDGTICHEYVPISISSKLITSGGR